MLATVRAGAVLPDPVLSLWKDGPAERIEIGVLKDETIEELLASALGGPVDAATVRELVVRSRGSPMFLRELVNGALETGALIDAGGLWRLAGALSPTLRLAELVALRLGELSQSERSVLEMLALGEPLGPAELAQLADPLAVDALEEKGLIASDTDGAGSRSAWPTPFTGTWCAPQSARSASGPFPAHLADVIEAVGARRHGDTLKVATWRLVGGGGGAELLVSGAMAARARHEYSLSRTSGPGRNRGRCRVRGPLRGGRGLSLPGSIRPGRTRAGGLATQATSDAEKARVALLRFDNVFFEHGADFRIIDDILAEISDPFWRDELDNRRIFVTANASGPRETMEVTSTSTESPDSTSRVAVTHRFGPHGPPRRGNRAVGATPGYQRGPCTRRAVAPMVALRLSHSALLFSGRLGEAEELLTLVVSRTHRSSGGRSKSVRRHAVRLSSSGAGPSDERVSPGQRVLHPLPTARAIGVCSADVCRGRSSAGHDRTGRASGRDTGRARCPGHSDRSPAPRRRPRCSRLGPGRRLPPAIFPPPGPGSKRRPTTHKRSAASSMPPARSTIWPAWDRPTGGRSLARTRRSGGRRVRNCPRRLRQRGGGQRQPGSRSSLRSLRANGRQSLCSRSKRGSRRRPAT